MRGQWWRRRRQQPASPADTAFDVYMSAAEDAYQAALVEHEAKREAAERAFAEWMRDPDNNQRDGLPAVLPDETIAVLARSRALAVVEPEKPRRDTVYAQHGVHPNKFIEAIASHDARLTREAHGLDNG